MFKPVTSKVDFPQLEEKLLKLWQEKGIFQRSVDQRRGKERFTLYEGPPTANGNPGIHHVLARVFKDVIPRYKAMKGYYAPRIAGWDTHGLPVELEVEKQLGLKNKKEIEEYGIARFNAMCRDSVFRYLKEWNTLTERIAFWVDLEHPYVTMENNYIESGWWTIKQLWDKGLVYQGYKVTPHCPRCGTSLSSHEVALGYKDDVPDPSVYVKFKLDLSKAGVGGLREYFPEGIPTCLVAWTTTPWTLPGNTALAVSAKDNYAVIEVAGRDGPERLVLAEARLPHVVRDEYKMIATGIPGGNMAGMRYEPLFQPADYGIAVKSFQRVGQGTPILRDTEAPKTYPVIITDFVSMEDGTGIVHIAPAYGEADYGAGQDNCLHFVHTVDLQGKVIGTYPFAGKFVKTADPLVLDDLKSRNHILRSETINHTYPFCWRCGTPLLYYAKQSWYIRTTEVKKRLISGNEEINWHPEHIKHGRFGDWLQNNVDWAFSRERYWGTPLPVWSCEGCGSQECIGGIADLKGKPGVSGFKEPLDLHRPYIDEITFACGKCGGKMKRAPEVIDCWFDSGNMPLAQNHYPFDPDSKTMFEDGRFPADYICEAVDQTRGWFYSLHAISTLLFDCPAYKNVICLGLIQDAKGEKMSKTKGNVVQPWTIINKHGADALRWYCLTASPPGNVRRFDEKSGAEITRQLFLTLWNVYSFFILYANIDNFTPENTEVTGNPGELDRWLISALNQLILDVDTALAAYDPTEAGRKIESFVDELSNWYVRRSRRRFWKSENDADKFTAYSTLYHCLVTLSKLLAPFTPYLAEELYKNLVGSIFPDAPESVHLTDFPVADESKIDRELTDDIHLAIKISSLGRAARSEAKIKVRQPLEISFVAKSSESERALKREAIKQSILDELNVKDIKLATAAELADMAKQSDYVVDNISNPSTVIRTTISPELAAEGMAREIVHRLQTKRRGAGFEIADYILTYYQGDDYIRQVMQDSVLSQYIREETLSRELIEGVPGEDAFAESFKLEGHEIVLGVKKIS
ncbi:MAG: isoleucine--tRNA ligase [Dehalococcoidales bacterium]|nr:isoleucine--tRNA ligase [Dehalococcoidales bacterium]